MERGALLDAGILNTMAVAVAQRRVEIGILRSLGVTQHSVRVMFLLESGLLGLIGALLGIAVGYVLLQTAGPGLDLSGFLGAEPADPARGPAVRRFSPDDPITYSFTVYNPKISPPATTEIQAHVFRDGQIVWTGEPHSLEASAVGDRREFTVARDLHFGTGAPDGVYVLRVVVRNRAGRKTTAAAVQWMDFELRKAARE